MRSKNSQDSLRTSTSQRVLNEDQRVMTEKDVTPHKIPELKIEALPVINYNRNWRTLMISQEDVDDNDYEQPPAANTQQQRQTRTLTQDCMLHTMELLSNKVTPQLIPIHKDGTFQALGKTWQPNA